LFGLFLLAITLLAYQPVWHAGFIWDDDTYVTNNQALHSLNGLRLLWFVPGVTAQYYPLTFTTFWLEYHLWGLNPLGYHLVNVSLHAFNAVLLWLILRRLNVPGAWLAAAIFALHPVCVESVAWITEGKNTLSALFYLSALLAAFKFWLPTGTSWQPKPAASPAESTRPLGDWKFYWLALGLYLCALLSKTTTIPLPFVILLLVWWQRGRLAKRDALLILPFLALGAGMGLITMHVERHLGTTGSEWNLSWFERSLIAGKDFWFYLGKLFWPHPLIFMYPRWETETSQVSSYLPTLAMVVCLFVLWWKRHDWARPLFVAMVYFAALLLLVLGFFNIYYFRYSFVSDHFQYLAMLGPLTLAAAGMAVTLNRLWKSWPLVEPVLGAALLLILGGLTWQQCQRYANVETLWRVTVAQNPDCWLAENNLGYLLLHNNRVAEALNHLQAAVKIHPDDAMAENNLGSALLQNGNRDEALVCFKKALAIQPEYALAYNNLGDLFLKQGRAEDAMPYLLKALALQPSLADAGYNLGNAYLQKGQLAQAVQQWQKVLTFQPDHAKALNNLGNAFLNAGQIQPAIGYFRKAVAAEPNYAEAENNLGSALIQSGQLEEAVRCLSNALATQPDFVPAQNNLAWVLATCPQNNLRNGREALKLAQRANQLSRGNDPLILRTLAATYAENNQFTNAIAVDRLALRLVQPGSDLAANLQEQIQRYETGSPSRD